jgi:FMN phosphatase YigB (HAD superfamily)
VVVSADDVATGKPDPAIYHAALKRLTAVNPRPLLLIVARCVVVEDSERASAQDTCTRQAGRAGKSRDTRNKGLRVAPVH